MSQRISRIARRAVTIIGFSGCLYIGRAYLAVRHRGDPVQGHRPFNTGDTERLRDMSGLPLPGQKNPGVRVTVDFCTPEEEQLLIQEAREMVRKYGKSHADPETAPLYELQMSHIPNAPPVNMMRVTGRPERKDQSIAPWKYGDEFDPSQLPPTISSMLERVQQSPDFKLGKPRDVTINYRHSGYFRLDPHTDPPADGENVFIIGLGSNTVLTVSPVTPNGNGGPMADERLVARLSWSRYDVDALSLRRSLLHICGPARNAWNHGIRQGIAFSLPEEHKKPAKKGKKKEQQVAGNGNAELYSEDEFAPVADWFGTPQTVVPRRPERFSVVFAFAHPSAGRWFGTW
eukprot:TRINITY_DN17318_c0_g1_i1.p2 TRINITY_DN17318_c0_g1~~TRINITY_DN17318_c0_g1_i1.p2  ORF type:complete len:345 (+),score=65.76 TRINITY_DN17318_c0_g1_i1:80-1114(+)